MRFYIVGIESFLILISLFIIKNNAKPIESSEINPMLGDKFEGDILGVDLDMMKGLSHVPDYYEKWPNGVVPYILDKSFNNIDKSIIRSGMKLIEDQTRIDDRDCIKFVDRSNETTYLNILNHSGCSSYVGKMKSPGGQDLSLESPGCIYPVSVAHELMHSLGFWHEQARFDRDNYIKINWNNLMSGTEFNFEKRTFGTDTLGFPYDYYSIMHYEWNAFSSNGFATIEPYQSDIVLLPTSKKYSLSSIDVAEIRAYYGCS